MQKTTSVVIRVLALTGKPLEDAIKNLKLHLGPTSSKNSKAVKVEPEYLVSKAQNDSAITCDTKNVEALLERVREWLALHPRMHVEVVDSAGHILLRENPPEPKIKIHPFERPNHILDASFRMEVRKGSSKKPSTKHGHIPNIDFHREYF